jgi:3-(3-hydroxy-phenyl)propionate hydroxylase
VAKGVSWNVGRTFFREEGGLQLQSAAAADHKRPGMINLQQYYLEEYEIKRARELPNLDLRFRNKVVSIAAAWQWRHAPG